MSVKAFRSGDTRGQQLLKIVLNWCWLHLWTRSLLDYFKSRGISWFIFVLIDEEEKQGITQYMIFQQFIQRLHRHFLRKCAAFFDVLISAGTKAFYMHMVSAQIQGFTFVISLVFLLFLEITQLWIQQLMKLTNNQFNDKHNNQFSVSIKI